MTAVKQSNRILIVDDDPSIRGLMAKHFTRHGYEVEQAEAAEEVMERFGGRRFDVVVTDVHLPGESGVDLARRMKGMQPDQPIVFMTGDADAGIARQALHDGANGYLLKPFEFFEMDAAVKNAMRPREVVAPTRLPTTVARVSATAAHVTVPARVVLAPSRPRRSNFFAQARVVLATAAMLVMGWLAGVGLAPTPVTAAAPAPAVSSNENSRPIVIPMMIERTVYSK
jgi:DNA-binding response OmpR family regulator